MDGMDEAEIKSGHLREDGTRLTNQTQYITGWKLYVISILLLLSIFIVQMESSITSTAILAITDDLGGYERSSWLFTGYFITYCGLQMIWAKTSDIVGRKPAIILSLLIFTVFSGMCGASQTMTQLIHFRWVQGVGGCGVFALVQLACFELVPAKHWPTIISVVTGVIALSTIAGPLVGGAVTLQGDWRWIFLLNVPIGVLALVGLCVFYPKKFWNEPASKQKAILSRSDIWIRIDVTGSALLLGFSTLLSTGLQQAATGNTWKSAIVIALLACSGIFLLAFLAWQRRITLHSHQSEPVFPWRFVQSRHQVGMILNTFFVGAVLYVTIVQVPQRFIAVHGLSPLAAAVRLMSFGVMAPVGSSVGAILLGKLKIPPCWIVLFGAVLQVVGTVLLSQLDDTTGIHASQYGFQVMMGTGVGLVNVALTLLVPYTMDKRDLATGTSAISQFRVLGGLVGISIAASISTPYIRSHLLEILPLESVALVMGRTETIHQLQAEKIFQVRTAFSDGYSLQIQMLIGFAAAQVPTTALMWSNKVAQPQERQD